MQRIVPKRKYCIFFIHEEIGEQPEEIAWRRAYRDDDQCRVASGQPDQQVINGRFHLRPRQDDHRDGIAEDPEKTDQVDKYAVDDKVR